MFLSDPLKKRDLQKREDNAPVGEDEKSRILRMIEQEDSEDDESSDQSGSEDKDDKSGSSFVSE